MTMGNEYVDKWFGDPQVKAVQGSGAGISMQININIPFSKVLDGLYDQVKSGKMPPDTYYAILDQYEKIIDKYRNVKL